MSADGTNGVRVEPITAAITIKVCREPILTEPYAEHLIERAWQRLWREQPRYFNGRILSFESYDATKGIASARDVEYRLHAMRESVDSGIAFFGVTGVLRVIDGGTARYMLGKRGVSVHEYPNQWELAPCGGIDPPPPGQDTLSPGEIARELSREAREELGLDLDGIEPKPIALVHDDPVGSTDLMMLLDLTGIPTSERNWEYSQSRWLTLDEIDALHASPGEKVIPTTLAMLAHLRRGMPPV